jgi:nucleotide-binding universal stress UspA family protein
MIGNRSLAGYCTGPYEVPPINIIEPAENFLREAAKRDVAQVKKLCDKSGVSCRTVISLGHPSEEIIKEAERSRFHLIILASHGKRTLAAVFLGSVTYGVIHKETQIPVLIVRKGEKNK